MATSIPGCAEPYPKLSKTARKNLKRKEKKRIEQEQLNSEAEEIPGRTSNIQEPDHGNKEEMKLHADYDRSCSQALSSQSSIDEQMKLQNSKRSACGTREDHSQSGEHTYVNNRGESAYSHGRSGRRGASKYDQDVFLSKKLSYILRHKAETLGFNLLEGGYLYVDDVLSLRELRRFTFADMERVVRENDKQRFTLEPCETPGKWKIKANQGHSMKVSDLDLRELSCADVSICVHGTNYEAWDKIKRTGLKPMRRMHIHFAPGEPGESGVISGMRSSASVLIFVNIQKAIRDGIKFMMSANNVILSEGDEHHTIRPEYFLKVIDRQTRRVLFEQND